MDNHYVLYSEDTDTGIKIDYMSEACVKAENNRLARKGGLTRWIPYKEFIKNH